MGYDDFGLRIGIEGEKTFKDALRDINQSFKVLGSEMQLVTSQKMSASFRSIWWRAVTRQSWSLKSLRLCRKK